MDFDNELCRIAVYYPEEVAEIEAELKTGYGQKVWACRRLNEIRRMFGLYEVPWPPKREPK